MACCIFPDDSPASAEVWMFQVVLIVPDPVPLSLPTSHFVLLAYVYFLQLFYQLLLLEDFELKEMKSF